MKSNRFLEQVQSKNELKNYLSNLEPNCFRGQLKQINEILTIISIG